MMYIFLFLFSSPVVASEMEDKVMEASYIQSGLKGNYDQLIGYGRNRIEQLGLGEELGVAGYCVRSYRSNSVRINVNGTTIEIHRDSVFVTFGW